MAILWRRNSVHFQEINKFWQERLEYWTFGEHEQRSRWDGSDSKEGGSRNAVNGVVISYRHELMALPPYTETNDPYTHWQAYPIAGTQRDSMQSPSCDLKGLQVQL
ncbi:uncharacterized protein BKA55DRAFT_145889 [Fusarium redolens]|uniref:Uncharacterized protein n=1 Tax=Fusarium redolens TaxID=48865 RepID=A0A9P9G7Y8_FUSRE|nr:uncharacterized protein BKA55DRAFT_145889 [Fusarium redolens]KAH7234021.1 hypothetical protein BKA55DRAFT_145889 [Fusarium redolens]